MGGVFCGIVFQKCTTSGISEQITNKTVSINAIQLVQILAFGIVISTLTPHFVYLSYLLTF